ncbi:MAG: serpin family protein [Bacteroidia bacterium]|nr:serpin family protein [Bacteroidia bacterium]
MKRIVRLLVMVFMAGFGVACDKEPDQPQPTNLTQHELKVLQQGNHFGFDLINLLGQENPDSNLCISPYSIYTALSMAANGADNQTLVEMLNLLGFAEKDLTDLNSSIKNLNEVLIAKDPATIFETANSVWYNTNGFTVFPDFVTNMQNYYSARVEGLDFSAPSALPTVNSWVKENTHDKIDKIIEKINPDDVCFLINALYFNGKWTTSFDKKETHLDGFTNASGKSLQVPTMYLQDTLNAINTRDLQAVELPYGDGSWSMYLFLPPCNVNLDNWCNQQLSGGWDDLRSQFATVSGMEIYLPQFKLGSSFELSKQLKQLGIPTAFTDAADFSRLGPGSLAISQVLHKTVIDVNEEGTEAAAVTAVIITRTSMPVNEIRFNHPFLFVIAEKSTGSIIFIGKLMNPE